MYIYIYIYHLSSLLPLLFAKSPFIYILPLSSLLDFYGVASENVGLFLLPFAAGNFLGPLTIGRLFDIVGRRTMISATYFISGMDIYLSIPSRYPDGLSCF